MYKGNNNRSDAPARSKNTSGGRKQFGNATGRSSASRKGPQDKYYSPIKKSAPRKAPKVPKEDNGEVRLNKFIANSGICSRREADTYIQTGLVTVNGKIVTELGTKVKPGDDVRFNGERLKG